MNKNFRSKAIIILAAAILATGASACGVSTDKGTSSKSAVAATTTAPAATTPAPTTTTTASGELNPKVAPGGNFDLSGWQLQLPIGSTGSMKQINGNDLKGANGYTDTYFYTDKTDGAMTLMDPTIGITSSGSLHCRTELKEATIGGWSTNGTNILAVTAAVTQVPHNVCIGQIFQATGPSKPLCELQYKNDGTISLLLEKTNQGGSTTSTNIGSVPLGTKFKYELSLTGTTITVTINGTATEFTMPSTFVGETFYFKAGDYDQTATSGTPGTTPGTVVKIYSLDVTHK